MAGQLSKKSALFEELRLSFEKITGITPVFTKEYVCELEKILNSLSVKMILPSHIRKIKFLGQINLKFRLNAKYIIKVYEKLSVAGFAFNYHEKSEIQRAFDESYLKFFLQVLTKKGIKKNLRDAVFSFFSPVSEKVTILKLHEECKIPSKLRKEQGGRDIRSKIIESQFSSFLWSSFSEETLHACFDSDYDEKKYSVSFWEQLLIKKPNLFKRENALHIIRVASQEITREKYNDLREKTASQIQFSFERLNNHGFLAVIVEPLRCHSARLEWEFAGDLTLFSEKFMQCPLEKNYFRWKDIESTTAKYIPSIDLHKAEFHLVNEGFIYKDCFVVAKKESKNVEFLVLLFQKNKRDETLIPCPTCRSSKVQANSYSTLGVRSWECKNLICPDRSKYNRGKRYSFRALIMQQAIEDDRNKIDSASVRQWNRDVIFGVNLNDILKMLISHYSIFGDTVHLYNWFANDVSESLGRIIVHGNIASNNFLFKKFLSSSFFERYICGGRSRSSGKLKNLGEQTFQVFNGDALVALKKFRSAYFDGAVTSPPYYNAREYSTWPNIYCYLHDMYQINKEVFRTLKPGAFYFYNIFDYFDNEMTTVFSAMGQKRMILSAYAIDMFRRIGFLCVGNIVWDKGDIEGKRGFNAGNFSPFYQAPFNCWEHILVFQKPPLISTNNIMPKISYVFQQKPVFKMVNGKNIHGHSAPFPDKLPALLISNLGEKAIVVDPFGGSLTTGRVADRFGIKSVCIEKEKKYCDLGLSMWKKLKENKKFESSDLKIQVTTVEAI